MKGAIYNTELYRVTEDKFAFYFETKRKAYDKGSRDAIQRFNKKYYNYNTFNPMTSYSKKGIPTADEANKRFNEDLLKGITIKTLKYSGKFEDLGVLSLSKGKLHFVFNKRPEPMKETNKNTETEKEKPEEVEAPAKTDHGMSVIFDPSSEAATALIGKNVELSRSFTFTESRRVVLTEIFKDSPMPFVGKTIDDGRQVSGVFIREYRIVRLPLDLNDKAVRDSLRGKWIFNKVTGQECLVSSFRKENGHYVCNGLDARTLMTSWELEDGGFLGIEK